MAAPKDHIEPNTLSRKRSDLFALCLTVFIALNCASYFVRSSPACPLSEMGYSMYESIGFPFVVSAAGGCLAGTLFFYWHIFIADCFIALLASWLIAKLYARKLPFLIREQAVPSKYSTLSLLVPILCMAVLLLVFRLVFRLTVQQQAFIYSSLFLVSAIVGIIWSKFRYLSWAWLAVAGIGLFFLAILVNFPHNLDSYITIKCIMRAFIVGGSILSGFVLLFSMFRFFSYLDELAEQARETVLEESEEKNNG